MKLELDPPAHPDVVAAVQRAAGSVGIRLDRAHRARASRWLQAGQLEAVERLGDAVPARYTLSPRRTRGATRA